MTDGIGDTPLTERYFDTSLLRLAIRLLPLIDLSQRPPPVEAALIFQTLPSPPDAEQMWTAFDAVGRYLEATQAPGAEYTNPELMLVAICKVRSLLLAGEPDRGALSHGDTFTGQVFFSILTIGTLAVKVFGDEVEEIMHLKETADAAISARKGRAENARRVNATRTAWHEPALKKAQELREKYPFRSDEKIGELVHGDRSIDTPSHTQTVEMVRQWRREGTLKARQKASSGSGN